MEADRAEGLDLVRRQLVRLDATVDGVTDRILRRTTGDRPEAPAHLVETLEPALVAIGRPPRLCHRR